MVKHINLGVSGETPRKETYFNRDEAPSTLSLATPQRSNNNNVKSVLRASKYGSPSNNIDLNTNIDDRPKTSRGKAMPSPDEFTSYVIPSPPKARKDDIEEPSHSYNNSYPNFRNAVWSEDEDDEDNIKYDDYDSSEDSYDKDDIIMQARARLSNSENNLFSSSFRHSNQDDFINNLKNNNYINDFVDGENDDYENEDDGNDYEEVYDDDEYDDDDDEYDDDDDSFDDYIKNNGYDDNENPILADDRLIALGCWLLGSALKV